MVAGLADDLAAGIEAAREAIDSGAAVAALAALVEVSQREAARRDSATPRQSPITTVILVRR